MKLTNHIRINPLTTFAKSIAGISANLMLTLAVAAMFAVATVLYWTPAEAQTQSTDATLSDLKVSPKDIIGFDPTREYYEVGVASTVATATITATTNHAAASVEFDPAATVTLSAGRNEVTVTVTAEDGTEKEYTVSVNQGVTDAKGWKASADLDGLEAASNHNPEGIWANETTMWVVDYNDNKIFAYTLSDGSRDESQEFNLDSNNTEPVGIWSNGETMWVADDFAVKVFAYTLSGGARDADKDIDTLSAAGNNSPTGIWSNGTTMWVADSDDKVFAYTLSDGTRDAAQDFNTSRSAGNTNPQGIWSNGTTMWVADWDDGKLYAYTLSGGTWARDASRDFDTLSTAGNTKPRGISSHGTTMWVAQAPALGHVKVYAYNMPPPSTDATLSELKVTPKDIIGFDPTQRTSYEVGVASTVAAATITATANDAAASVEFDPIDADGGTDGHQVTLSPGRNEVTVTVTAEDGTTEKEYTVSVNQGVTDAKGWQAPADLDGLIAAGNNKPYGIWSSDTTMWVADSGDHKIYAYTRSDGSRVAGQDIDTLSGSFNNGPSGIWSNGETMWVANGDDEKVYAHTLSGGTWSLDAAQDIDTLSAAGNRAPTGIWSNGETMWVADIIDEKIYAYTLSGGTWSRDTAQELNALSAAGNNSPTGIWSNGTTMWVADNSDDKLYAYTLSGGARDESRDFDTLSAVGNNDPRGIWSYGETMWVADWDDDKVYAYNMPPPSTDATLRELKVSPKDIIGFDPARRRSYDVGVDSTVDTATITATTNDAAASVAFDPIDADGSTDGHQVTLSPGRNEVTVTVTAEDGTTKKDYTVSVNQGVTDAKGWQAGADLDSLIAAGNTDPRGIWANDATMWVSHDADDNIYAYTRSDGSRDTDKDIEHMPAPLFNEPRGIWSDGETMWVAESSFTQIYAYMVSDGTRDAAQDITLHSDNQDPRGIWSNGETMWVADWFSKKIYAYTLSGGTWSRDADQDLNTLIAAGNQRPTGIWSDGETMWVADQEDDKLYAYTLSGGTWSRDGDQDIGTLSTVGNNEPSGIWSDGETMWVADYDDDKLYAYNMPPPSVNVSFAQSTYTVTEGSTVAVTVTLSAEPKREVTIPIVTSNQDGASDTDYMLSSTSLTFGPAETSQTITFEAVNDIDNDDDETVELSFGSPLPMAVSEGSIPDTEVSITDSGLRAHIVAPSTVNVDEDSTTTFDVHLSHRPSGNVTVRVTSSDTSTVSVQPATLSFTTTSWNTPRSVTVRSAADDDAVDDTVTVRLTASGGEYGNISRSVFVKVIDDDSCLDQTNVEFPDNRTTPGEVNIGRSLCSQVEPAYDVDWFAVDLIAGNTYVIDLEGRWTYPGTLFDPILSAIYMNGTGNSAQIAYQVMGSPRSIRDDNDGEDRNSRLMFTVVQSGRYYIAARGFAAHTGTYRLTVRQKTLANLGDIVYPNGTTGHPLILLRAAPAPDPGPLGPDTPDDTTTTATVIVNGVNNGDPNDDGRYHGQIDTPDDRDWVRVWLKANKAYVIHMLGAGNAWSEDENSWRLTLRGPRIGGIFLVDRQPGDPHPYGLPGTDGEPTADRWAAGPQSAAYFTASETGWHYIKAQAQSVVQTGTYAVHVFNLANPWGRPAPAPMSALSTAAPPGRPQGLTGSAAHDVVSLTWDDPDDASIISYQILRRDRALHNPGIFQVHVDDTGSAATSYVDRDVAAETRYVYRVRARNAAGLSAHSKSFSVDTPAAPDPALNHPATGAPTISGTARVGETLTADTSGIADADGLTNATFTYQWIISLGGGTADIPGATGSTYTPEASHEGIAISVRVSFTDDAGHNETLTSAATAAVLAAANSPATGAPSISGTAQVGETLTADTSGIADDDGLTNVSYSYQWIAAGTDLSGATSSTYTLTANEQGKTVQVRVSFTDDEGNNESLTSTATDEVDPAIQAQKSNSPATGAPTISGTARVGETLTANTSAIADDDGLTNVSYSYQWIAAGTDLSGATSSTYALTASEQGKTIQVKVSFTDDGGNDESLTSTATAAVTALQRPRKPQGLTGTVAHDVVSLTWDDPDDASITGYQILRRNRDVHQPGVFEVHVADTGSAATSYVDRDVAAETRYAYRIKARNAAGLSARSDYFNADTPAKPNIPATGAPAIEGEAVVGETLTADTSGIQDADGLTNATFSYQWILTDGGPAELEVQGATEATYTVLSIDKALRLMVRVSFTDDAGNGESLTSAATEVVKDPPQ